MSKRMESSCYGCPECRDCGRDRKYPVWTCDKCGFEDYEEMTRDNFGRDLCNECYESED